MTWEYGAIFNNAEEFISWVKDKQNVAITEVHVHHTYDPDHSDFTGSNHLQLQDQMKDYHISQGYDTIAQHVTVFPDGKIVSGRDINKAPASATGWNDSDEDYQHPFMIETLGNFDTGYDVLEGAQLQSLLRLTQYFKDQGGGIRFHRHAFLKGQKPKSCPGTSISYDSFVDQVLALPKPCPSVEADDGQPGTFHRNLYMKYPMFRGNDVKALQEKLGISADGIFGWDSRNAVIDFQCKNMLGQAVPIGFVNEQVWNAIFSI